jgi:hypothetical protein
MELFQYTYKGVVGAGRPPSLLVVANLVLNYFDYCYISLVSMLTQLDRSAFTLVSQSELWRWAREIIP